MLQQPGIRRVELEDRALVGLKDHLIAPEAADTAVRAWAEETNRLNRERNASSEAERKELADIEKKIDGIVDAIQDGAYSAVLKERLHKLEARKELLNDRLVTAPLELPDIHPNVSGVYRRKVARLAKALRKPEERDATSATARPGGRMEGADAPDQALSRADRATQIMTLVGNAGYRPHSIRGSRMTESGPR